MGQSYRGASPRPPHSTPPRSCRSRTATEEERRLVGEPARLSLKVRHYEVDEYGHVNHANYVHYLEAARIEALEALGLSLAEMREQGYLIVAADLSVRYHSPARPAETLDVVTYISEIRGARSVWMQ